MKIGILVYHENIQYKFCFGNDQTIFDSHSHVQGHGNLTYLTYSCSLLGERRAVTTPRQRTFFNWAQLNPASFASDSADLLQICLVLPTFLFSWGFQSNACLVMFSKDLHVHRVALFTYLGSIVSKDGGADDDVKSRPNKARQTTIANWVLTFLSTLVK